METSIDDIKNLTDYSEIQDIFLKLRQQEENVTKDLDQLLQNQAHLETKMKNLNQILPQVSTIEKGCVYLHDTIHDTNVLAEKVSRKVRQLDMAKGHVDDCVKRVNDIIDLMKCVEGVQETMASDNYELAASHIHKYLSIDKKLIRSIDDDVDGSLAVLKDAELRLINNINNKLDTAVKEDDRTAVERFTRLYPLVGRPDDGLSKYSKYIASKVAASGQQHLTAALKTPKDDKRWGVMFADTITRLFEDTARLIESSLPVVHSDYGKGNIAKLLTPIQEECTRQARNTVNNFLQTRNVIDLATAINNTNRAVSVIQENEIKKLDQVLEEMVRMNSHTELYSKFIQKKIENHKEELEDWNGISELRTLQQETMGHYILLENYYMQQSINKAVSLETRDSKSLVSSLVDDACYVVQKSVNRAITSKSVDTSCAMINNAASSLSIDVCNVLLSTIKTGYPNTHTYSWQQGTDEQVQDQKERFLAAINNAFATAENIIKLKRGFETKCEEAFANNSTQLSKLMSCISGFNEVQTDFKDVQRKAEQNLCKAAIFPKLHPVVAEFASSSHLLTEDQFYILEVEDPWLQEIVKVVDELIVPLKPLLKQNIYNSVVATAVSEMSEYLEKLALTCSYNQLGALLLDKRLRSLVTYLTGITQWSIRDKFTRLTQIAMLISCERLSEVSEYSSGGSMLSRLSTAEIKQCFKLRTDFRKDDIERLDLEN